ncbi:lysozyme inhibitor LprI family protein [Paraburkholderia sp. C35]|uniref:lysozyme inhibitor LprI family protein n=1 Tax=Paraburkholderia sp. C35 TaxID=2126993 RepID=UPI000D6864F5|nr:lysozyme inhibitor LprI family protein [Paraburkholderia sp. C35]
MKFKANLVKISIAFNILTPVYGYAHERIYSNEFDRCSKQADNSDAKFKCVNAEILLQKKRLNSAYAKLIKNLTPEEQVNFDRVQREWIVWRNDNYNFLAEHVSGEYITTRVTSLDFLLNSIYDRVNEIEMIMDEMGVGDSGIK